jgi:energy-coupling factor transporter ATP-binding protein EcfA2
MKLIDALEAAGCGPNLEGSEHWMARCPAHADRTPSLSINHRDGKWLMKCHAGCEQLTILRALGLGWADCFDEDHPKASASSNKMTREEWVARLKDIVATYPYSDEAGRPVFEVVRFEKPKEFRQRRRGEDGRWKWSVAGMELPLYRLPEVRSAIERGDRIVICEGEKDVQAAMAARGPSKRWEATTNPGGAGAWKPHHTQCLIGASVTVVVDTDKAGWDRGRHLHAVLTKIGCAVRVVKPLAGKDLADHLAAGHTMADLLQVDPAEFGDETTAPVDAPVAETAETLEPPDDDDADGGAEGAGADTPAEQSKAEALLAFARERMRVVRESSRKVWCSAPGRPRHVLHPMGSVEDRLRSEYRESTGRWASKGMVEQVLSVMRGQAQSDGRVQTNVRVHQERSSTRPGTVTIDLGRDDCTVLVIDADGWRLADDPADGVFFRRVDEIHLALPDPVPGGNLDELRDLLNVSDESWPLVVGWLVQAWMPATPCPILGIYGPAGSGKTTVGRALATLLDPTTMEVQGPPKDPSDLLIAAAASRVTVIDNLSRIDIWFSDALCRLVTGEATLKRQLYTDEGLAAVRARGAVALTSIESGSVQGDLASRMLRIDLDPIDEETRGTESELLSRLDAARPRLLGALADLVSTVLRTWEEHNHAPLPRVADFGVTLRALDALAGTDSLALFTEGQRDQLVEAANSSLWCKAVVEFAAEHGEWIGSVSDLYTDVTRDNFQLPSVPPKNRWPSTPSAAGQWLARDTGAMRQMGVKVEKRRSNNGRGLRISIVDDAKRKAAIAARVQF